MLPTNWKQHVLDVTKGAIGAAVAAFALSLINSFVAHIPQVIDVLASIAGGTVGVKTGH